MEVTIGARFRGRAGSERDSGHSELTPHPSVRSSGRLERIEP